MTVREWIRLMIQLKSWVPIQEVHVQFDYKEHQLHLINAMDDWATCNSAVRITCIGIIGYLYQNR